MLRRLWRVVKSCSLFVVRVFGLNRPVVPLVYTECNFPLSSANQIISDDLSVLANHYGSDKGTQSPTDGNHHGPRLFFTPIYDFFFEQFRDRRISVCEIGIGSGSSLPMWSEYFPFADIFALDIAAYGEPHLSNVKVFQVDQSSRSELRTFAVEHGPFDFIIDDGGHMMGQQQISFGVLFEFLQPGGWYFIEDLHTSFWPFGGFSDLYGNELDINQTRTNTTYRFLLDLMSTGKSSSEFLTDHENQLIEGIAEKVFLFDLPDTIYGPNRLAAIRRCQH